MSRRAFIFGFIALMVIGALYFAASGGITGLAILDTGAVINSNSTFDLGLNVTSLRITGSVSGTGNMMLYLGDRIVVDTRILNESLENYCLDTCEIASGVSELPAVVDGDALMIVTAFNYTGEPIEEIVNILPIEENETVTNNSTFNQTDGSGESTTTINQTF